ncbi:NucA/NucB deoxyribonuclease domain-containing protein [Kitasatospora sp. NPDC054939]
MSHPIAKALEDAARKIGTTVSKQAAQAVGDMYDQASTGAKRVAKNITDADDSHKRDIIALAEKIAKNPGKGGDGSEARLKAQADARTDLASAVGVKGDFDVELLVDSRKYPESAQHIAEAQAGTVWRGGTSSPGSPKPSVMTIDRGGAKQNRKDSLRGIPTKRGQQRDEYPPAMFSEGGTGASVKYIDGSDNGGSGSTMGNALGALPDGTKVRIKVV